ncbi:MAG TPA: VOC family protein [Symbiobacteriaceae bacterium]|jgi:predicted lactoylglutathione lyase|nr:VOC family protein [Symbiobacteriaceae bacterium]
MARQIYVNLAIADVERTRAFYTALGFRVEEKYSGEKSLCLAIEENIYVMLLAREYFQTFTPKAVTDARESTEVLVCISCDSRAEVDELVAKAVAAGGRIPREKQDLGFMYGHAFEDLDGHIWELAYMEPNGQG